MKNLWVILACTLLFSACYTPVRVNTLRPRPTANTRVWTSDGSISQRANELEINYLYEGSTAYFHIFDVLVFSHRRDSVYFDPSKFSMTVKDAATGFESRPYAPLCADELQKALVQMDKDAARARANAEAATILLGVAMLALAVNNPSTTTDLIYDFSNIAESSEHSRNVNLHNIQQLTAETKRRFARPQTIGDSLQHGGLVFFPRLPNARLMRFHFPIDSTTTFDAEFGEQEP